MLDLDNGPIYLTKLEAAQVARCSVDTIERAIRKGHLRAGGTPGLVRIKPEWVEEWLTGRDRSR